MILGVGTRTVLQESGERFETKVVGSKVKRSPSGASPCVHNVPSLDEHVDRFGLVAQRGQMKSCAVPCVSSVQVRPPVDRRPQDIHVPRVSRPVNHEVLELAAPNVDVSTTSQKSKSGSLMAKIACLGKEASTQLSSARPCRPP